MDNYLIQKLEEQYVLKWNERVSEPFDLPQYFDSVEDLQEFISSSQPILDMCEDCTVISFNLQVFKKQIPVVFNFKKVVPLEEQLKRLSEEVNSLKESVETLTDKFEQRNQNGNRIIYLLLDEISKVKALVIEVGGKFTRHELRGIGLDIEKINDTLPNITVKESDTESDDVNATYDISINYELAGFKTPAYLMMVFRDVLNFSLSANHPAVDYTQTKDGTIAKLMTGETELVIISNLKTEDGISFRLTATPEYKEFIGDNDSDGTNAFYENWYTIIIDFIKTVYWKCLPLHKQIALTLMT